MLLYNQRRQKEREETGKPAEGYTDDNGAIRIEKAQTFRDEPKSRPTTAARIRAAQDMKDELFMAVDSSDKNKV